jgi:hypothetical protein
MLTSFHDGKPFRELTLYRHLIGSLILVSLGLISHMLSIR